MHVNIIHGESSKSRGQAPVPSLARQKLLRKGIMLRFASTHDFAIVRKKECFTLQSVKVGVRICSRRKLFMKINLIKW